jgi:hypothetical protein
LKLLRGEVKLERLQWGRLGWKRIQLAGGEADIVNPGREGVKFGQCVFCLTAPFLATMVSAFPFRTEGGVSMNARIRAISAVGVTLVSLAGLACNKWHSGGRSSTDYSVYGLCGDSH